MVPQAEARSSVGADEMLKAIWSEAERCRAVQAWAQNSQARKCDGDDPSRPNIGDMFVQAIPHAHIFLELDPTLLLICCVGPGGVSRPRRLFCSNKSRLKSLPHETFFFLVILVIVGTKELTRAITCYHLIDRSVKIKLYGQFDLGWL